MRTGAGIAVATFVLIGGCSKEPGFNEAYEEQATQLNAHAANMQAELSDQLNAAALTGPHNQAAR